MLNARKGVLNARKGVLNARKGVLNARKGVLNARKGVLNARERGGKLKFLAFKGENAKIELAMGKPSGGKRSVMKSQEDFFRDFERKRVTKSNSLIEARYRLSINEQRLILLYISMLTPDLEDMPIVRLKVRDIIQALEINSEKYYSELKEILKKLRSRVLEIPTENGYIIAGWIDSARYYSKKGEIILRLSPELKPYLLKLKEAFTTYYLKNVLRLRSFYSIRLYELLKQYENIGKRKFKLEELRKILKIEGNKYKKYSDFKRFVILLSQKELEKKTDIAFDFREIKQGRKVVEIEFLIKKKKTQMVSIDEKEKLQEKYKILLEKWKNILEEIKPIRLTKSQVIFFLENSLLNIEQTVDAIKSDDRNPKVYNPVGVLMSTLPLRKNPKYLWLLKYETSKMSLLKELDWYEEYFKKIKYVQDILNKFQIKLKLERYNNPQTEEEAFKYLKEIEMKIAKELFNKLTEKDKHFINNQLKNLEERELRDEIFTSFVFQKYGLKSINLYTT